MTEEEIVRAGREGLTDWSDPRHDSALAERARAGQARSELGYLRKDGTAFTAEVGLVILPDGEIVRHSPGHHRAQTGRRGAAGERERFRLALRNAPVSVAVQDRELRYMWAYNQRTARPDEITGKHDHEILTPDEAARVTAIKRRVLEEGVELHEQMWFERPSGRVFLDTCCEPIRDEAGRVTGVASATVDLTPIKQAETRATAFSRLPLRSPQPSLRSRWARL